MSVSSARAPSPIGEGLSPGATPGPISNLRERSRAAEFLYFFRRQLQTLKKAQFLEAHGEAIRDDTKNSLILKMEISMIINNK